MNWIKRFYEHKKDELIIKNKITIIYGPRRCGKTSLVNKILENFEDKKIIKLTGDDFDVKNILETQRLSVIQPVFDGYDIIFLDEAQYIKNIGNSLKLIIDNLEDVSVIVTGSSSFDISETLAEPLTGRHFIRILYPISCMELKEQYGGLYLIKNLENFLIFGMYPEVLTAKNIEEKKEYLFTLRNSYLFKDILAFENIKNSDKIFSLLKLLAFQVGKEVSLTELSNNLGIAKKTVERYLDLLEKCFVIKKIKGFSKNLRSEVTKTSRYYFYDNGILNSITSNFNLLDFRNDVGQLWENFIVMEILKKQNYKKIFANNYFWRTYQRQEIDFIQEYNGKLYGYEIKWKPKKVKPPKLWINTYPDSEYNVITKENFIEFVC